MSRRQNLEYFQTPSGAPPPLSVVVDREVRYEEVDVLGIVWHGRYVSFLEEGRATFGKRYGLDYLTMHENRILTPIVEMHIDYHLPMRLDEKFQITAELFWSESARINFQYRIVSQKGNLNATAYTVQLLTDNKLEVQLVRPPFMEDFCDKWKRGLFA